MIDKKRIANWVCMLEAMIGKQRIANWVSQIMELKFLPAIGNAGRLDDVEVVRVDGNEVKMRHTMEFVEGGNDLVWEFIPSGQIWVDAHLTVDQQPYVVLHEMVERTLVRGNGLSYASAHGFANKVERRAREASVFGALKDAMGYKHMLSMIG